MIAVRSTVPLQCLLPSQLLLPLKRVAPLAPPALLHAEILPAPVVKLARVTKAAVGPKEGAWANLFSQEPNSALARVVTAAEMTIAVAAVPARATAVVRRKIQEMHPAMNDVYVHTGTT